jgi:pyruvate-formate lyase-activating enzyme
MIFFTAEREMKKRNKQTKNEENLKQHTKYPKQEERRFLPFHTHTQKRNNEENRKVKRESTKRKKKETPTENSEVSACSPPSL